MASTSKRKKSKHGPADGARPRESNASLAAPSAVSPAVSHDAGQNLIAVLLRRGTWLMYGFFKEALQGIQRVAFSQGYGLMLINPYTDGALDNRRLLDSIRGAARGL